MPYLGNAPAEAYSNIAYQDFGTESGTTFTLDFPAGAPGELEVFVNNVRQEPSVAYTVSGTTLTMTGAIASTDDFYVVFQGKAQQTVRHPANTALEATSGTFSGDLTVDTDTLYVDSTNNRVGIETSLPSEKLTVSGAISSSSNALNFNQAKATFDYASGAGRIASYASTGSSLQFYTNPNGGTVLEAMRIDSSGNLLVGTTSTGTFDGVGTDIRAGTIYLNTTGAPLEINQTSNDAANRSMIRFFRRESQVGSITSTTSATSYNTSSDYRLKENVTATWDATTRLKQLNPVRFNFIADAAITVDGFLAHEVQTVVPEAISGTHNEVDDDGNPVYQGIDQSKLVPLLCKTIQELEARITALETA